MRLLDHALRALPAIIALSGPRDASANFIGVSDERSLEVSATFDPPGFPSANCSETATGTPSSAFSSFDTELNVCRATFSLGAIASQRSSFSSTRLEGTGSASMDNPPGSASARSTYSITFSVDTSTPFTLQGELGETNLGGGSHISLTRGTETLFSARYNLAGRTVLPFSTSGVLVPGEYRLLVDASGGSCCGPSVGPFTYEFELVAVPEPSPHILVGSGVAMLAWHRVHRSRRTGQAARAGIRPSTGSSSDIRQPRAVSLPRDPTI